MLNTLNEWWALLPHQQPDHPTRAHTPCEPRVCGYHVYACTHTCANNVCVRMGTQVDALPAQLDHTQRHAARPAGRDKLRHPDA